MSRASGGVWKLQDRQRPSLHTASKRCLEASALPGTVYIVPEAKDIQVKRKCVLTACQPATQQCEPPKEVSAL